MLIVPNTLYFFGSRRDPMRPLGIVSSFDCGSLATVYLTEIGAVGCEFKSSGPLASIAVLDSRQSGAIPENVTQNRDQVVDLQVSRVAFINFLAAAIFGRVCARHNHRALEGAIYRGLDNIFPFAVARDELWLPVQEQQSFIETIAPKVRQFQAMKDQHHRLNTTDMDDGISSVQHLLQRASEFEYADLQSCIVMNYQAASLHGQQHAGASLALNVATMEALIHEIFLVYGLVGDRAPRQFATRTHTVQKVSNGKFSNMRFQHRLQALLDGGLIDTFLHHRIDAARLRRNSLMHGGEHVSSRESGDCQTAVRDVWSLLIEGPFELKAGWTYRY